MSHECTHVLPSGQKCKAPAVIGSTLCRHHRPRKRPAETSPFVLPEFNDSRSLLHAVSEVLQAVGSRRMKRSEAGTLLFGLQLASRFIGDGGGPHIAPLHDCCEPELSCNRAPQFLNPEEQKLHQAVMEQAEQFLANILSPSALQSLGECETSLPASAPDPTAASLPRSLNHPIPHAVKP